MEQLSKILSGGQTGVDQAALDVAIAAGIAHGGWCPKGRLSEDGVIPERFKLQETATSDPSERTRCNIEAADATWVVVPTWPMAIADGTQLTIELAGALQKPHLLLRLDQDWQSEALHAWLAQHSVVVLNIAGPRASNAPGIYQQAYKQLCQVFCRPHV